MKEYGGMSKENWDMLDEWQQSHKKSNATADLEKPAEKWIVTWHVNDHAEGEVYTNYDDAKAKYDQMNGGSWATRLYDP